MSYMTKHDFALRFLSLNLVFAIACASEPQATAPTEPAAPTPAAVEPSAPVAEPAAAPAAEPAAAAPTPAPEPAAEPAAAKSALQPTAAKPVAEKPAVVEKPAPAPVEPTKPVQGIAVGEPMGKPCGEDGQPECPLQAFMEHKVDDVMESGDLDKLAAALKHVADLAPDPSWNSGAQGWAAISNAGAAAASGGDAEGARASCKGCHRAWRKKYKESYRARPL
jgi:hypothetical protein